MTMVANTDHPPQKPSLPARLLRPKVAVPLMLLLLLILSPFLIRGYHLSRIPDVGEPFDIEARYALVVPDEENAYVEYREAAALYVAPSPSVEENLIEVENNGWGWATPELKQHLQDNEPALRVWRRGTDKDRAEYSPTREFVTEVSLDLPPHFDEFVRTASAFGSELKTEGRAFEAWDWYRSIVRLSRHCGQNGSMVARMNGCRIFFRMAQQIQSWAADPLLNSQQLRQATSEFARTNDLTERPSTIIQIEYLRARQAVEEVANSSTLSWKWYMLGEPDRSRRVLRYSFQKDIELCDLTTLERRLELERLPSDDDIWPNAEFDEIARASPIAVQLIPGIGQFIHCHDQDRVRFSCTTTLLAGQAYYRDHGHFPATLGELVPDYLPEIPIDPFDGLPLKYRLDDEGAVVYSVFTNGVDDGGGEFSFDQAPGSEPRDYGLRLHTPGERPLVAPKPRDSK